jgi:transketolase
MRDAFVRELTELAAADERIVALTADLGVGMFDELAQRAPGRFLNVGIAEQTLVGVAAGLAYAGKIPVAYSNAPFITSRAHDQVRVDVAFPRANAKLVGVGAGIAYGYLGMTHHAIEDLALMRSLPGVTVLTPGDPAEAAAATRAAVALDGPVYLRLGKNGEPRLLPADATYRIGEAVSLVEGSDVTIATVGTMLEEAVVAVDRLERAGVSCGLLHFGSLKPFDAEAVAAAVERAPVLVSVEEHNVIGGLGSAIAEAMAERGLNGRLVRLGLPDTYVHAVGSREYLLRHYGLDRDAIVAAALPAARSLAA